MLNRYSLPIVMLSYYCINNAFDKSDLIKVQDRTEWMFFQLQTFGWPCKDSWISKKTAIKTGAVTEIQWDNIHNFEPIINVSKTTLKSFFEKCKDEDAQKMYQFASQADSKDDLVLKQNKRDSFPLTAEVALQRLAETAIFEVVEPTKKNTKYS